VISATTRLIANSFETALPKWKWIRMSERGKLLRILWISPLTTVRISSYWLVTEQFCCIHQGV
jgi:hypothetical protein